ncbi:MAG: glycosyltransferase family 2 protein [Alphaproteobacteria bacterium]|nr:MAG: glycosyltransferase family 2 protein [Alphaproteobacteria bacterium]
MAGPDSGDYMALPAQKPFKIVALSMARNEQDMIEPFVRHNLKFVDYMLIADNNSVDNTRHILERLARETGRVAVWDRSSMEHTQADYMTAMMHAVQSVFFSDFMVFLDADEFIGARDRAAFEAALQGIPSMGCGRMPWRTYVLPKGQPVADMSKDPPASMNWYRLDEYEQHYKSIIRFDGRIAPPYQVGGGNHRIFDDARNTIRNVILPDVPLLHFPVRSEDQLSAKAINGWMAVLAKQQAGHVLSRNECHQWRENFERAVAGTMGEQLADASYFYSRPPGTVDWEKDVGERPHGISYERRYSDGSFASPLALVARSWHMSFGQDGPPLPAAFYRRAESHGDVAIDGPVMRLVADLVQPATVMEVGCGTGARLAYLDAVGAGKVFGIDDTETVGALLKPGQFARASVDRVADIKGGFDLFICLGGLGGLDAAGASAAAAPFAAAAKKAILFRPSRGIGGGLKPGTWRAIWQELGWHVDVGATLAVRAAASGHADRRHLMLLRPGTEALSAPTQAFLTWIESLPFDAPGTGPALYDESLKRDIREYLAGYLRPRRR